MRTFHSIVNNPGHWCDKWTSEVWTGGHHTTLPRYSTTVWKTHLTIWVPKCAQNVAFLCHDFPHFCAKGDNCLSIQILNMCFSLIGFLIFCFQWKNWNFKPMKDIYSFDAKTPFQCYIITPNETVNVTFRHPCVIVNAHARTLL